MRLQPSPELAKGALYQSPASKSLLPLRLIQTSQLSSSSARKSVLLTLIGTRIRRDDDIETPVILSLDLTTESRSDPFFRILTRTSALRSVKSSMFLLKNKSTGPRSSRRTLTVSRTTSV